MTTTSLPPTDRLLLGPGPSTIAPRVMRALAAPVLSHLDPELTPMLEEVRQRLGRVLQAPGDSLVLAVSGTGTAAMEAAVANLVAPGTRVLVVVTGYFGDRLAEICRRYGAALTRVDVEWGRAADPDDVRTALRQMNGADLVCVVHAETSTGVRNPVREVAALAHEHGALVLVDAVTSLGGHPLDMAGWGLDAVYSCSQKCLGAPSGMSPVALTPAARARRVPCRSFYLDLELLEDYWVRRKYHHTLSASLLYAVREALTMVEEEGLETRWARHRRHHEALVSGCAALGLDLLPDPEHRLWTLNAIRVPPGVDEAAVRRTLLTEFSIEIGAGLGPLAGRIWRVGLMGSSSTPSLLLLFLAAFGKALAAAGYDCNPGAGVSAAQGRLAGPAPTSAGSPR
jgi:alanine-glyoxylate transaminase/serine-glyoxylate transaminase/serine-pyruvate transaminase